MPAFQVVPFTPDHLFSCLSNPWLNPVAVADHRRATYLSEYLQAIGAQSIVVEYDYTDGDYLDDFASYYVKCFQNYERRCKRLHFFASPLDEATFRSWVRGEIAAAEVQALASAYLGFVVARPLPDAIIGRTVLRTYPSDGGRRCYPATRDYQANLFGITLSVRSLAFQEQDSVLAACATVAIWSAFHKTADLFGTPILTPVEITRVANQLNLPSRPVPSHGLNIQQICNSIRHVGLEPEVVQVGPNTPLVSLIYGHLRMGLPVLLMVQIPGLGGHAGTLNGYSLRNHPVLSSEVGPGATSLPLAGLRIDKFYGHDDQFGPFGRFHIKPADTLISLSGTKKNYPVVFHGAWLDATTKSPLPLYPEVVVIPVYHKIRVTFLDALQWLTRFHHSILGLFAAGHAAGLDVQWDLSLVTTNEYKNRLKISGLATDRRESLLTFQHPRFIWHASLFLNATLCLELLLDATDMARSFPIYQAIWHDAVLHAAVHGLLNQPAHQALMQQMLSSRFVNLLINAPPP